MKTNAKLYVLDRGDGIVKLGHAKDPATRSLEIGKDLRVAYESDVKEQVELIERTAHKLLALAGKKVRGEWFRVSIDEAVDAIKRAERIADGHELPLVYKVPPKPFPIRLNDEELQMLDDIRREEPDLPVRSEMVRRLIERAHEKVVKIRRR